MSGIHSQVSDQTNQAIALLGGATAQSYSAMSLSVLPAVLDLQHVDRSISFFEWSDRNFRADVELASPSLEKQLMEVSIGLLPARLVMSGLSEEPAELPGGFIEAAAPNPDLMSRFVDAELEGEGALAMPQTGLPGINAGADELSESVTTPGPGLLLLDFIEQVIAQAEASQQGFEESFDGSRQGEFRELFVETSREFNLGVREFLQENIAGLGRTSLSLAIDSIDAEPLDAIGAPLLSIDYYAKSAEILNGIVDVVAQPIGSVALPRVGPLLANPFEESSVYLG